MKLADARAFYQNILRKGVHTIVFEKADGTLREMEATLDPEMVLAIVGEPKGTERKPNEKTLPVLDMEAGAWRAFTVSKLVTIDDELAVEIDEE